VERQENRIVSEPIQVHTSIIQVFERMSIPKTGNFQMFSASLANPNTVIVPSVCVSAIYAKLDSIVGRDAKKNPHEVVH